MVVRESNLASWETSGMKNYEEGYAKPLANSNSIEANCSESRCKCATASEQCKTMDFHPSFLDNSNMNLRSNQYY